MTVLTAILLLYRKHRQMLSVGILKSYLYLQDCEEYSEMFLTTPPHYSAYNILINFASFNSKDSSLT